MEAIAHISLDAISNNYEFFQQRVKPAQVIPVVKANAYGHGALAVTKHLYRELGVNFFAVATLEEAIELAVAFPEISIIIFSRVFDNEIHLLPRNAIISIGSMDEVRLFNTSKYSSIKVHLNVNTGMNRLGVSVDQAIELISDPKSPIDIQGVYSHYSSSDTESELVYNKQNERFREFVTLIRELGFTGMIHQSNSAGVLHADQEYYDAVRLGIGLYGYDTSPTNAFNEFLKPVMTVQAPLVRVGRIKAGESVSYAEKWQAAVATNIGTVRIGYADGYSRALTNRGFVSIQGKEYPVVGTVTMDHIMIDLGQDRPKVGSVVTVLGGDSARVTISAAAHTLNTITYEICCAISPRVKRVY